MSAPQGMDAMSERLQARKQTAFRFIWRTKTLLACAMPLAICTACRTPNWCAQSALRCLPQSADRMAPTYWNNCANNQAASTVETSSRQSTPTSDKPATPPPGSTQNELNTLQQATYEPGREPSPEQSVANATLSRASDPATTQPRIQASLASMVRRVEPGSGDEEKQSKPSSDTKKTKESDRFQLPSVLPGADTPPLTLPRSLTGSDSEAKDKATKDKETKERDQAFQQLYPPLSSTAISPDAAPESVNGQLGLDQLQELARANNPALRADAAAVESARGQMIQAGLPPNPNVGYEADTVRTAFTNGYQGAYLQQTFITAQKLGLAAQAAAVDYANAQLNLQRTWYTVISEVRRQYFNTLAARKRLELAQALQTLSERAYTTQIELVKAGEAAAYEPLQLRVLTTQAKAAVIQAEQDSIAAWRALSAAIGMPQLPSVALEGRIDCPVPEIDYDQAISRLTSLHTDIQSARNLVGRNRTLVTLADRKPIPDLNVGVVVQHDDTFNPGTTTYNLLLGGAVPVFDRNQGNRISARADLVKASQSVNNTSNTLIAQLAPAYATYQTNRQLATSFRTDALRDQVRAYRGIYMRYRNDPSGVSFNDIIVAQQTLAATLTQYLGILQSQWQGVVNVGELLQVNDIFELGPAVPVAELPQIIPAE